MDVRHELDGNDESGQLLQALNVRHSSAAAYLAAVNQDSLAVGPRTILAVALAYVMLDITPHKRATAVHDLKTMAEEAAQEEVPMQA